MEPLTISIIANFILLILLSISTAGAFYLLGNNQSLAKMVKMLYRDKKGLQKDMSLINNRLSIRAGLGELKGRKEKDDKDSGNVRPTIVSPAESIQRIQPVIKSQPRPEAKQEFWKQAEELK